MNATISVEECIICRADLDHDLAAIACGHTFHFECINHMYRKYNKACPTCRKPIKVPPFKLFLIQDKDRPRLPEDDELPEASVELKTVIHKLRNTCKHLTSNADELKKTVKEKEDLVEKVNERCKQMEGSVAQAVSEMEKAKDRETHAMGEKMRLVQELRLVKESNTRLNVKAREQERLERLMNSFDESTAVGLIEQLGEMRQRDPDDMLATVSKVLKWNHSEYSRIKKLVGDLKGELKVEAKAREKLRKEAYRYRDERNKYKQMYQHSQESLAKSEDQRKALQMLKVGSLHGRVKQNSHDEDEDLSLGDTAAGDEWNEMSDMVPANGGFVDLTEDDEFMKGEIPIVVKGARDEKDKENYAPQRTTTHAHTSAGQAPLAHDKPRSFLSQLGAGHKGSSFLGKRPLGVVNIRRTSTNGTYISTGSNGMGGTHTVLKTPNPFKKRQSTLSFG